MSETVERVATPGSGLPGDSITVDSLITQPLLTVEMDETLWDAWQLLFVSGLRSLVVIDDAGSCIGLINDRTILSDIPLSKEHLERRTVADVISRIPLVTIRGRACPGDAAAAMSDYHVSALPVLDDDDRLVGIVTASDLVRWLANSV